MPKAINDSTIYDFIINRLDVTDFGYLVIPDDARINDEALCNIKKKFKEFVADEVAQSIEKPEMPIFAGTRDALNALSIKG